MITPESIHTEIRRIVEVGVWGQVKISQQKDSYEVRHVHDQRAEKEALRKVTAAELRDVVAREASGNFRPLKSAPDLVSGWRHVAAGDDGLLRTFEIIYPGWIVEALAYKTGSVRLQSWKSFSSRQTGIYKKVATLGETEIERVVSTCCSTAFCMRRPVWHVKEETKFPCVAPCAVVLEFARFVASGAVNDTAVSEATESATCDFANPSNPRTREFHGK